MEEAPLISPRSQSDVSRPLRRATQDGAVAMIWNGWTEIPTPQGLTGGWTGESVAGRFLAAMKVGNFQNRAAEWAGVSARTIQTWLRIGRDHIDDDAPVVDLATVDEEFRPYVWLVLELRKAEAHSEVELVTLWRSAAKDDWRAARDLLGRRHPQRWKERVGSEVSGANGGPVQLMAVSDVELARQIAANPKARSLATELLAELAPVAPVDVDIDEDDNVEERWSSDHVE
jgi:hypothetical protein